MKRLRIALLDDHAVVRHGLVTGLQTEINFNLVGVYSKSREAIVGLTETPADLLLLDFELGPDELDGVSLIRAVKVKFPTCRILILSSHHDPSTVALALRVGARGFVGKQEDMAEVINAIKTVARGEVYLTAEMSYRVGEASTIPLENKNNSTKSMLESSSLSAREREVIRCYLAGMTVSQIAEKFHRSIKTVSTQKAAAFRKLGVTTNNGLFRIRDSLE